MQDGTTEGETMDSSERRRCMRLLQQAKTGEEGACNELVETLARHFFYMVRGYNSVDPAFDRDDLRNQFQLGIWQAIAKVDGRGDPLFHLAWRGQRAVCSMLNAIKQRRYGTPAYVEEFGERSIGTLPETWDLEDRRPESDPNYELLLREEREEARQHVAYLLSQAQLTPRQHDVVDWMMGDQDIAGEGANLRLARALGISPQLASKYRQKVIEVLSGQPPEQSPAFECLRCGRPFQSKGALTQHLNGQSGHRPCAGQAR